MQLMLGIGAALLLGSSAWAERISRAAPGTAPCGDDKAVRVLAVGGELQPNSWCNEKVVHKDNTGKVIHGKTMEQERVAFKAAKEAERARKKQADDERARQAREAKEKAAAEKKREANRKDEERVRRAKEDLERKAAEERKKREQRCHGLGGGAACTELNPGKYGK